MSDQVKLDAEITVQLRPRIDDITLSYGNSAGDNTSIGYNTHTTIYVENIQEDVTYQLFVGTTPSGDFIAQQGGDESETIVLPTDALGTGLTENTTFCVLALKEGNGLTALVGTITVIVKPDTTVAIEAIPLLIDYNSTSNIQVAASQLNVGYRIQGYDDDWVEGNGREIDLATKSLQENEQFHVEAINLEDTDPDGIVEIEGDATVEVRPNPKVAITIPDLNEQDPGADNDNPENPLKIAIVVCNRALTVHIEAPQAGITYQLWRNGMVEGSSQDGETYTMQSDPLDSNTSFQILATKEEGEQDNYTLLTDTVNLEIEEQVSLVDNLVYYGDNAQVNIKASENDKTYTLYREGEEVGDDNQSGNDAAVPDGTITLATTELKSGTDIHVTQHETDNEEGTVLTIAQFTVDVTDRIVVEPSSMPYNGSAVVKVALPVAGATYQLRYDEDNTPYDGDSSIDEDGLIELPVEGLTATTMFNVLETLSDSTEEELEPVIKIEVMDEVSLEQDSILYNTPAVIFVCDSANGTTYTLSSDINESIDFDPVFDTETKVMTLTTTSLLDTGTHEITVSKEGNQIGDPVELTVGERVTAASPIEHGSQAIIQIAATLPDGEDNYTLHEQDQVEIVPTEYNYDADTEITTLTTIGDLTTTQIYEVKEDGNVIGTGIEIVVAKRVTASHPISYYAEAVIHVAVTDESNTYELYIDNTLIGGPVPGNGGTLELTSAPLRETTTFKVKENGAFIADNEVTVTLAPQAYADPAEVPYNSNDTATIVILSPEPDMEYYAKNNDGKEYEQDGIPEEGEDVIISITDPLTQSTVFEVYKRPEGSIDDGEKLDGDVRIVVIHQIIEETIEIDYDGPAFIRVGASHAPIDNIDDDGNPEDVDYYLRLDADNTVVGTKQIGDGGELTFQTDLIEEDTLFNIFIDKNTSEENEEFRVWVRRKASVPVDISTQGPAMVSYDDTATVVLQTPDIPDATKIYEILNNTGTTLVGPVEGNDGEIEYTTAALATDTHYIGRASEPVTTDENGAVIRITAFLSRQTVMTGRLKFYGTYHFIEFGTNPLLQITGDQTIEMWVKAATPGTGEQILYDKARTGEGTTAINDGGIPEYHCGDADEVFPAGTSSIAEWTHLAVVRTGTNVQWYLNGVVDGTLGTLAGTIGGTTDGARIGAEKTADLHGLEHCFNGLIAEVRIWDTDRTDYISDCMNKRLEGAEITENLVAYWKLDENEGTVAGDSSGNSIQGTINGAKWDDGTEINVHHVIEKEITIDEAMPVAVSVGESIAGTDYQLLFAEDDSEASGAFTSNGGILTLVTDSEITATTRLTVKTTSGEEVGTVPVTKTDTPVIDTEIEGLAMITYGDDAGIIVTATNGTICELCDETYRGITSGTVSSSTITLTIPAIELTEDSHFIVRTKQSEGQTVYITKAPLIMVGLLSFDHTDDVNKNNVAIADNDIFHFAPEQDFTVEAWIKPTSSLSTAPRIVSNRTGQGGVKGFDVYLPNDNIQIYIEDSGASGKRLEAHNFFPDQWQHIATVFRRTTLIEVYLNGDDPRTLPFTETPTVTFSTPLCFMSDINADYRCSGVLSEVRIWDKALSQEEIIKNKDIRLNGDEDGLIGYWKLDERTGSTATDTTINDNDGTITGAEWLNEEV